MGGRSFSLRTRVAGAAALGAILVVALAVFLSFRAIERNNLQQTDQQLRIASRLVIIDPLIATGFVNLTDLQYTMALTVRDDGVLTASSSNSVLPALPPGTATVTVDGQPFRVLTTTENQPPGRTVSLAIPTTEATEATAQQQQWVLGGAGVAVAAAAALGWLFGGRAVRPIVSLTKQVSESGDGATATDSAVEASGVAEAEQLADAVNTMLARVEAAQGETAAALETARDFAAVSAHELRTPLTAMRTDLEVLRTLQLEPEQRYEILEDIGRSQNRVEQTLTALERLARGDLTAEHDHVRTDIAELCDQAAHDAMRHYPDLQVQIDTDAELLTRGLPAGLRLAIDNALTNSAKHGGATEALVSAHRQPGGQILITVDDNGTGIPAGEREQVFQRFTRGSVTRQGGSGLGLALVAQQAQLHGGRAYFTDSPLGGIRLVLELPERGTG